MKFKFDDRVQAVKPARHPQTCYNPLGVKVGNIVYMGKLDDGVLCVVVDDGGLAGTFWEDELELSHDHLRWQEVGF